MPRGATAVLRGATAVPRGATAVLREAPGRTKREPKSACQGTFGAVGVTDGAALELLQRKGLLGTSARGFVCTLLVVR